MKTFKVTTYHTVYIDNYKNGEGEQVNFYTLNSEQKAETPREAIEKHFNNTVYLPFNFDAADTNEEKTVMFTSNLVDEENGEPSKHQIDEWTNGEIELYANNIEIMVQELAQIKF